MAGIKKIKATQNDFSKRQAKAKENQEMRAKQREESQIRKAAAKDLKEALKNNLEVEADIEIKQEVIWDPNE
jgi:hypothetical protein